MICLTEEKVLELHSAMAAATGGSDALRDKGLMTSALMSPQASFGGVELYPSIEEKAARLGFSLISNHAFVDGNKRIGIYAMLVFLEVNGVFMDLTDEDVVRAGLGVAGGEMDYQELLGWVRAHRRCEK